VLGSVNDMILPDCVACTIDDNDECLPLSMTDLSNTKVVVLPLTSRTLLVGASKVTQHFDPAEFNKMAASCSHSYFISASDASAVRSLLPLIVHRSVVAVDLAVKQAFVDVMPDSGSDGSSRGGVTTEARTSAPRTISVTFVGAF